MQRKLRQVCVALKEHGRVSYAKIASAGGFSDINLIIIKATPPDDLPLHEKYIQHLLKIFSLSPSSFQSFSLAFTRRFRSTRSWRVALKCLLLLHRLLRSVPANSPLRSALLSTRSTALLSLFQDGSGSSTSPTTEYTLFIRSYALFLNEALNCVFLDGKKLTYDVVQDGEEEHEPETSMKEMVEILEMLLQIQSLMDRVMAMGYVPMGTLLARSVVVRSAMKHIIRDSFVCYAKFRKEINIVLENLLQMPYKNCVVAFTIYKKAASQTSQLYEFYDWCKAMGICGLFEYPIVDRIPHIQIQALETFLKGMWELTESSSSSPTTTINSPPPPSSALSPSAFAAGRDDAVLVKGQNKVEDEEEKPLIDLDDDSWETLLESSISFSHCYGPRDLKEGHGHEDGSWIMKMYKPAGYYNPFSQPNDHMSNFCGRDAHHYLSSYPKGRRREVSL